MISYVNLFQNIKDVLAVSGFAISFASGRLVNDFLQGANFIFFKHAFDIGDRVDLYNAPENNFVGVIVKRISLLYVIFERTDDGKQVQFSTERLNTKRIENLTRSGLGVEKITIYVDINTSFKDIEALKADLKSFLSHRENRRDYKPDLSVRIKSVHELNKLELAIIFTHKSNWSKDGLKSARSSRFYTALVDAIRRVPINRPGPPPPKLGDESKPQYLVSLTDAEAAAKRDADALKTRKKRSDWSADDEGLDAEGKKAKEQRDKTAEVTARDAMAAIPASLVGTRKERPDSSGIDGAMAQATGYSEQQGFTGGRRRRVDGRGRSYDISGPYSVV